MSAGNDGEQPDAGDIVECGPLTPEDEVILRRAESLGRRSPAKAAADAKFIQERIEEVARRRQQEGVERPASLRAVERAMRSSLEADIALAERLARVERILRDQGAHEPDCPAGWKATTSGWGIGPCACWLSEEGG